MVTVTDTTAAQSVISKAAGAQASPGTDFNMFLKLLTTQMQNQDPLNPMDSTEYTQQLAQYSQVEQSVQQNSTLKDILASFTKQDVSQAASFIGRDATFDSSVSGLGDKPARWTYTADHAMTTGTVTISDASGKVVYTKAVDISGSTGSFAWDGTLADGTKAAAGAYVLAVKATDANGGTVAPTAFGIGTVDSVNVGTDGVSLGVNGIQMALTALVRLTAAGG